MQPAPLAPGRDGTVRMKVWLQDRMIDKSPNANRLVADVG